MAPPVNNVSSDAGASRNDVHRNDVETRSRGLTEGSSAPAATPSTAPPPADTSAPAPQPWDFIAGNNTADFGLGNVPVEAEEARFASLFRLASADGVVDIGEMLDVIQAAIDGNNLLANLDTPQAGFFENLAKNEGEMQAFKELVRKVNAARDAFVGVIDSLGDRRKKAAESISRV